MKFIIFILIVKNQKNYQKLRLLKVYQTYGNL